MGVIRHAWACPTFPEITKRQHLRKGLSYFVYLLHVVTHPEKLHYYLGVLVGYGLACSKFSKITNGQYQWKRLSDFAHSLHVVIYLVLDIH